MSIGSYPGVVYPQCFDKCKDQYCQEEVKNLKSENGKLQNKVNSLVSDKIIVLTPIAAVECPRTEQLEEVIDCQLCQYHNGAVIGEQVDKNLYGRVFCAYKDLKNNGMW